MAARSLFVTLLLLAAMPFAAHAGLYKWVDEHGVVNYGDAPPADAAKAKQLDESTSSLSVFPGMSKDELERLRNRSEQLRVERLEREIAELRARAATPSPPVPEAQPTYVPVYVVPRRVQPRQVHLPVHAKPVQRTQPFASMRLER